MIRARQEDTESQKRKRAADQPRPALGRRPWFALLRRARSLRRFAFAIRRESVARSRRFITIAAHDQGWFAPEVLIAESSHDRRRGLRAGHERLLIRSRCVSTLGLSAPIRVAGLDGGGVVQTVRVGHPGRLIHLRRATWALELPIDDPSPEVGEPLAIYARRCEWEVDALRDAHRQPR